MEKVAKSTDDFFSSMINDLESEGSSQEQNSLSDEETTNEETDLVGDAEDGEEEASQEDETETDDQSSESDEESEEELTGDDAGTEIEEDVLVFEDEASSSDLSEDLLKIGNDLGFGEIKSKDEFVKKVNELKAFQELSKGLPAELVEAMDVAKKGGDFKEYLGISTVNYDEYSNRELVEASMEKYFLREDGSIDEDRLVEFVDSKSPEEINMMGDQVRETLKMKQYQKKEAYKQQMLAKKQEVDSKLKSYISSLNSVAGVKVSDAEKDALFREISSGEIYKASFTDESGNRSPEKEVQNYFKIKYFDKILQLAKSNSAKEGKKEVIKKLTNSNVKNKKPSTKIAGNQNTVSGLDLYLKSLQKI